jgi:hypothetical protein
MRFVAYLYIPKKFASLLVVNISVNVCTLNCRFVVMEATHKMNVYTYKVGPYVGVCKKERMSASVCILAHVFLCVRGK